MFEAASGAQVGDMTLLAATPLAAIRICPLAATKKNPWPSQNVTDSLLDAPQRCPLPADYSLAREHA